MAMAKASYSVSQTDAVLVPAVPGKRLRVLRLMVHTLGAGTISLGSASSLIFGRVRMTSDATVNLQLDREFAVSTELGEALTFTSDVGVFEVAHTVTVWYDVVG